jgi:hypothetical protein
VRVSVAVPTVWREIEAGDVVLGGDGQAWTVTAREAASFTVEREGREPYTFYKLPSDKVTLLAKGKSVTAAVAEDLGVTEHEVAEVVARVRLGATVVYEEDRETGVRTVPTEVLATLAGTRTHIRLWHRGHHPVISAGKTVAPTLAELHEMHAEDHAHPGPGLAPHTHAGIENWRAAS